jgi:putative DNA primase/helicase
VAFNAGNLKPVALALRKKFPEAKIILCADNDRFTPGNPGVSKAREAALEVNGRLYVPRFEDLGPHDFYREGSRHE